MAPKTKFTSQEIISAALDIIRAEGTAALTARSLAAKLGSSPKPIFGLFSGMDEVLRGAIAAADKLYQSCIAHDMAEGRYPPYKASGMAYIRFAREERELFKLLFMRDRSCEAHMDERENIRPILEIIKKNTGMDEEQALLFHQQQWIYVHGLASMIATGYLDWDEDFAEKALSEVYQALLQRYKEQSK